MISVGNPIVERLPSPEAESRGFHRMERRMLRAQVAQAISSSRLRGSLIAILSLLLWLGLFQIVYEGFVFMRATLPEPIHEQVVKAIFNAFFFFLFGMLVFSSCVIMYGSLFRHAEIAFLLTMPIRAERVFLHKYRHAVLLSSWGFVLLGSPMLVAYGIVARVSWYYFALLLPMLISFVFIPAGIGAILLLLVMRLFPRNRTHVMVAGGALVLAFALWYFWSLFTQRESDLLTPRWFQDMLGRLQLTEQKPLPSWWLSSALLETASHAWAEGMLFLALLVANALFVREVAAGFAARIYRTAYCRAAGIGGAAGRVWMGGFDQLLSRSLGFLDPQVRLVLLKDVRVFRRDPVQWVQFVILFLLLVLYFINVHPFGYTVHVAQWISIVSFMNFSVVGLLMSTFTTRFVFPLVSLEGRRFWLLGLLPLKRSSILWAKFCFSMTALALPCSVLIFLSDWMLGVPGLLAGQHQWTSMLLCLGLSGIGVGLGARFPNVREQSPSRIAAGFGGTLNLVVSTIYIIAMLVLTTLPCHLYVARLIEPGFSLSGEFARFQMMIQPWLIAGTIASLFVGIFAMLFPMWLGIKTFSAQEFH